MKKEKKLLEEDKYPAVSIMLAVSMDENAREQERTNKIETKASTFISVIIAIFTLKEENK